MFNFGQFDEFSDSVTAGNPVIAAVAKAIELGAFVGQFFQAMGAPSARLTQKTFKVFTRSKTSRNGNLGATAWDNDDITGLSINANTLKGLTIGHVLDIDGEVVVISAVNREAGTISVYCRGDGGTNAAAHDAEASFDVIGFAGADTDLKDVEPMNENTSEWENYIQTVFEVIEWTKHAELVRQGISPANATAILILEAQRRVAELLSSMSIRGVKKKAVDKTARYMSAGLIAQLNDVTYRGARRYNVNGLLTETKFKAGLKAMFDNGGNANIIWCSPTNKEYVNAFLAANSSVTYTDSAHQHTAGGIYVDSYNYEGKILSVRIDAAIPNSMLAVVDQSKCKKGWLADDGLRLVDEPPQSSREYRKSLQGSVGFLIEDVGADHTLFYGITGGSTDRVHSVRIAEEVDVNVTNEELNAKITNTVEDPVNTKEVPAV